MEWPAAAVTPFVLLQTQVARLARLEQLSLGLGREIIAIRKGNDPMLYLERKAYRVLQRLPD